LAQLHALKIQSAYPLPLLAQGRFSKLPNQAETTLISLLHQLGHEENLGVSWVKEYNIYRAELMESGNRTANDFSNIHSVDASTQTDERWYRRREIAYPPSNKMVENKTVKQTRDDISPPPTSSPETLETLVKYNRCILEDRYWVANKIRGKTSAVLMHLISCGSIAVKGQSGVIVPQHGARLTRGSQGQIGGSCRFSGSGKVVVEKEYFSGSLLDSKVEVCWIHPFGQLIVYCHITSVILC
jgi:Protein SOSEKI 2, plant